VVSEPPLVLAAYQRMAAVIGGSMKQTMTIAPTSSRAELSAFCIASASASPIPAAPITPEPMTKNAVRYKD